MYNEKYIHAAPKRPLARECWAKNPHGQPEKSRSTARPIGSRTPMPVTVKRGTMDAGVCIVARGLGTRRFTSMAVALLLVTALLPGAPADANARCKAAAHHHHCAEMPSLTCCCAGDTVVATEVARPVAKASLLSVQQSLAIHVALDDVTGRFDARARLCGALSPSAAGPPLDRSILYSTLLL